MAAVLLFAGTGPIVTFVEGLAASSEPTPHGGPRARAIAAAADPMDGPLHLAAVDQAIGDAVHIARTRDEYALANRSRDCHRQLRADPTIARFDSCAAFDDAVVEVQDRDPLRDQGPFSELAVTGRQMSRGTSLSNDYLAIDGRLDRIRLRVELALAPALPPPSQPAFRTKRSATRAGRSRLRQLRWPAPCSGRAASRLAATTSSDSDQRKLSDALNFST